MINAVLVDDERAALDELSIILNEIGGVNIRGKYQDPAEAIFGVKEYKPDAVFLDIEMGGIDGFTLADEILRMTQKIAIVFATAYDEYAVKAFEMNAVDYVLKPFVQERLMLTIRRIAEKIKQTNTKPPEAFGTFIQTQKMRQCVKKVPVWKGDSFLLLSPHEILYFTIKDGEVYVVTAQGQYQSRDSLNFWEEKMRDQRFFRTHKRFLVNLEKVKQAIPFFNYTYLLKLEGSKDEIPVSRSYLKNFKQLMLL